MEGRDWLRRSRDRHMDEVGAQNTEICTGNREKKLSFWRRYIVFTDQTCIVTNWHIRVIDARYYQYAKVPDLCTFLHWNVLVGRAVEKSDCQHGSKWQGKRCISPENPSLRQIYRVTSINRCTITREKIQVSEMLISFPCRWRYFTALGWQSNCFRSNNLNNSGPMVNF